MALICNSQDLWMQFVEFLKKQCSPVEFQNWIAPIQVLETSVEETTLLVPNIFVQEYLLENYKEALASFFSKNNSGELALHFVIQEPTEKKKPLSMPSEDSPPKESLIPPPKFHETYTLENFIEGPSNQFVKSAALGVASRPGKSFNPLFIHGGVGLGKTHLLHGIGNFLQQSSKKLQIQCITTEAFINDLVYHLRNKSADKMKNFYRNLDVLLVDDIQFLQNRMNFEEEFCNTFENLIHHNKQIVITSDKPPSQLKLSERIIARMEWGLVAHVSIPELETRVAIIQNKAEQKGFKISSPVAFFIADHLYHNIRQLEGAINRLYAYCHLTKQELTKEIAESVLSEMMHNPPYQHKIVVEDILKCVAQIFEIRLSDLKGDSRKKEIAKARQVAMYLSKELLQDSLVSIATSFGGKTHSTILHGWKKISTEMKKNSLLLRQIQMAKMNLSRP